MFQLFDDTFPCVESKMDVDDAELESEWARRSGVKRLRVAID